MSKRTTEANFAQAIVEGGHGGERYQEAVDGRTQFAKWATALLIATTSLLPARPTAAQTYGEHDAVSVSTQPQENLIADGRSDVQNALSAESNELQASPVSAEGERDHCDPLTSFNEMLVNGEFPSKVGGFPEGHVRTIKDGSMLVACFYRPQSEGHEAHWDYRVIGSFARYSTGQHSITGARLQQCTSKKKSDLCGAELGMHP